MPYNEDELGKLRAQAAENALARIPGEIDALTSVLTANDDPVLGILLRFHLLLEEMLNRIIDAHLKRPEALDDVRLNFVGKLALAGALERDLAKETLEPIRRLNSLRNKCAHEHGKRIALEDLDRIGECLGQRYQALRGANAGNLRTLALFVFGEIYRPILTAVLVREAVAALNIPLD